MNLFLIKKCSNIYTSNVLIVDSEEVAAFKVAKVNSLMKADSNSYYCYEPIDNNIKIGTSSNSSKVFDSLVHIELYEFIIKPLYSLVINNFSSRNSLQSIGFNNLLTRTIQQPYLYCIKKYQYITELPTFYILTDKLPTVKILAETKEGIKEGCKDLISNLLHFEINNLDIDNKDLWNVRLVNIEINRKYEIYEYYFDVEQSLNEILY